MNFSTGLLHFVVEQLEESGQLARKCLEINLNERVWAIPAERMKANKEHRVPSSRPGDFVFPGAKQGRPLAATAHHGSRFQSTFREWEAERTSIPRGVAEMALAHKIPDAIEAAYRCGDLFEKRRRLMETWAAFCGHKPLSADVVPIKLRGL